jgi:hypothetical protein
MRPTENFKMPNPWLMWAVLGAIFLCIVFYMCRRQTEKKIPAKPVTITAPAVKKQSAAVQTDWKQKYDDLLKEYNERGAKVTQLKNTSASQVAHIKELEKGIRKPVDSISAVNMQQACLEYVEGCNEAVNSLTIVVEEQAEMLVNREKQVREDSATIAVQSVMLDTAANALQRWYMYGTDMRRQAKRSKNGSKFWRGVAIVLGGVIAAEKTGLIKL